MGLISPSEDLRKAARRMEPGGNADGVHKLVLSIKVGQEAGEPLVSINDAA